MFITIKHNISFFLTFFIISYSLLFQPILGDSLELKALMDIKALLDPNNKILRTWQEEGDPCSGSFVGVACNEHGNIANISLQGRGLAGNLSPAIGDLKSLSGIYLHYNSISGEIPREVGKLNQLTDLYLNVNNFTGIIPTQITHMTNLQVLDLCCNRLTGEIPAHLESLSKLDSLSLQYNQLKGSIPPSLGSLELLKRLDLSNNHLSGPIPATIANIKPLEILDVRNNSLSGAIPTSFKRLDEGFLYGNNTQLCGSGFLALRNCTGFDNANVDFNTPKPSDLIFKNLTTPKHGEPENIHTNCSSPPCSKSTKFPKIVIIVGVITASITLTAAVFLTIFRYRRQKQKIGITVEASESRFSTDHAIELQSKSASPLVYSTGWDPLADGLNSGDLSQQALQNFRYNLEEVESASQYFSETNLLGRGNFSTVYKGVLRDGSVVAIKSISVNSCQSEEAEFVKGLNLLVSLRHENLVGLRGFCCSRGRGECYFVYDFAPNGNLLQYLDVNEGSNRVLDWSTRVNIIKGIAKGLCYLHAENESKPSVVHQNVSAEKIVLDNQYNPLILDSGLRKILADDTIFSALKVSAAMGYLAPEYLTTGRFTKKSDVYAFGVIVLHILSGKQQLTNAMRSAAESSKLEDFVDQNLHGKFSMTEASKLVRLALSCTHELPDERMDMDAAVQELNERSSGS